MVGRAGSDKVALLVQLESCACEGFFGFLVQLRQPNTRVCVILDNDGGHFAVFDDTMRFVNGNLVAIRGNDFLDAPVANLCIVDYDCTSGIGGIIAGRSGRRSDAESRIFKGFTCYGVNLAHPQTALLAIGNIESNFASLPGLHIYCVRRGIQLISVGRCCFDYCVTSLFGEIYFNFTI